MATDGNIENMRTTKLTATRANGAQAKEQFKCDQCDRSFAKQQGLRMHQARAHKGIGPQKGKPMVASTEPKYRRRKPTIVEMRYCPCCGLNLQVAATAMTVALRHSA
jgi:hypothetical protein